jgi:uncharacterized tellurite resistance protein B-like protein
MFDQLLKLLTISDSKPAGADALQQAVAVLLLEAARMDDHFEASERTTIEHLLAARFGLSPEATEILIQQAQETAARSSQLYPFTHLAVERMTPGERVQLIEMLWEVAYADGVLDADEDALLRRVAGLIHVSDSDRVAARLRVVERLTRAGKL